MNTYKQLEQVREFMTQFKQWTPASDETCPDTLDLNRYAMYMEEVLEALRARTDVEKLDAAIDIWYVALGKVIEIGRTVYKDVQIGKYKRTTIDFKFPDPSDGWLLQVRNTLSEDAWINPDWIEFVAYAITKYLEENEIPLRAFELGFDAVHKSNLTKQWDQYHIDYHRPYASNHSQSPNGKYVVKSELGKILKPPSYTPPDLAEILELVRKEHLPQ